MNATSSTGPASYTVFFSHRIKDKHVAHSIKTLLTQHTANVDYFVSEDIEKGAKAYARVSGASRFSVQNRNTRVSCSSVSEEEQG
jgi:hypothetical protein